MAVTDTKTAAAMDVSPAKNSDKNVAKFYVPIPPRKAQVLVIGDDGEILLREEMEQKKALEAGRIKAHKSFNFAPMNAARPNVACRSGEINDPAWEEAFVKSHSETINIDSVRELKLPATPKSRTKRAKAFVLDVSIAEKTYIAGHSNHGLGELRLICDRDDTSMLNKTTDNIDDEPRQDRDLHVAKKKAMHHLRSASISPELLRQKAASRVVECRMLNEATNLLTKDPAIESINHVYGSPYRTRPTTRKEANRFHDLLSRLASEKTANADPAIIAIKAATTDKETEPHEAADKIVATQEQLAEKTRFQRSDSGYLSPPQDPEAAHASGSNSASTDRNVKQSESKDKSEQSTLADSGINSPTDASTLNPMAKEFVSSRASPTKGTNPNARAFSPLVSIGQLRNPIETAYITEMNKRIRESIVPPHYELPPQDFGLPILADHRMNVAPI